MKKLLQTILCLGSLSIFLTTMAATSANVSGELTLGSCVDSCFFMSTPSSINIPVTFLQNNGDNILAYFKKSLGQQLRIVDLRDNGGFNVFLNISPLEHVSDPTKHIPYTDIGIISFVDSLTNSTDGYPGDNTVVSLIDPVIKDLTSKPYNETTLVSHHPQNYFEFAQGTGANSDPIHIVSAPTATGRTGEYTLGLGLLIKTPASPYMTLIDGNYTLTLTFTLSST